VIIINCRIFFFFFYKYLRAPLRLVTMQSSLVLELMAPPKDFSAQVRLNL
jgi:hypothetical protein